jgi:hypothetical protein
MDIETYDAIKTYLKTNIITCNKGEQILFKRMYSKENTKLDMDIIIDNISNDMIHIPMIQLGMLLEKKEKAEEGIEQKINKGNTK